MIQKILVGVLLFMMITPIARSQSVVLKNQVPSSYGIRRGLSFSANGNGYMGLFDVGDSSYFWKYSPADDSWARITNMPGPKKVSYASGFVIGENIYIVGGVGAVLSNALRSVYEYNTLTGNWSTKNMFPDSGLTSGIGLSVGGKAYFGLGDENPVSGSGLDNSFYEYDPLTDHWTKVKDFPGEARTAPFAFVLDGKIIVGGGETASFQYLTDLWEYDPATDTWTMLNQLMGMFPSGYGRSNSFIIENNAYTTCGQLGSNTTFSKKIYRYNPDIKDFVESVNDELPNTIGRADICAFSIGSKGYIVGGWNQTQGLGYKDVYQFTPQAVGLDVVKSSEVEIFPNPANEKIFVSLKNQDNTVRKVRIIDTIGKTQLEVSSEGFQHTKVIVLDIASINAGVYFLSIEFENGNSIRKICIE